MTHPHLYRLSPMCNIDAYIDFIILSVHFLPRSHHEFFQQLSGNQIINLPIPSQVTYTNHEAPCIHHCSPLHSLGR
jgi:hypothetical protein